MDGKKMFSLIEKLNFVRVSGTPEEKKAADIVAEEVRALGLEPVEETFTTQDGLVSETYLEVTEPYNKVYKAQAYRRSGSCEVEAEIKYVEDALDVNLKDCGGKILLSNRGLEVSALVYPVALDKSEASANALVQYVDMASLAGIDEPA